MLDIAVGDSVLRHSRRGLVGEEAIEVSRSVYAGSRFTRWVQVTLTP